MAGVSEKGRAQCQEEVELMFVDVKKAHLNAKCEEEEWVELPDEFKKCGKYAKLVVRDEKKRRPHGRTTTR